ncbi:MAG: serine hydrolase [Steroidobacteraceae bacterium]|nr:serine hydrolase [Steroidobacteraceae bacterium]
MKRWAGFALALVSFAALAAPPRGLDQRVESLRKAIGVPGMAVVIVEDGRTTYSKGFGVRRMDEPARVDADTIFPSGSTGKAVTVAALATLVDSGRIGWDDKVIDHLADFRMYDPWVTREMTIRDLLVHRSGLGLGAGDLLFVPRSDLSRAESVKRLRHLKPATSFRNGFAYDNVLYMVAGQLIEAVSGQTWEDYVREHVFGPAGMLRSTTDSASRFATADRAFPHARASGPVRGLGPQQLLDERDELGRNAAPAGGLAVSANDMAKWLALQLAGGKLPDGERLFSEASHAEMWTPVVITPTGKQPASLAALQANFSTYALGWSVRDYRGVKLVMHGGAVLGFQCVVALLPAQNVGVSILINSEDGEIVLGLLYELLDHYLGFPKADWLARLSAFKQERLAGAEKAIAAVGTERAAVGPSLALERYTGTYADAWYGNIEVTKEGEDLRIDFRSTPRMAGRLEHWQYDTFVTRFDDPTIEPAYVTFTLDASGKIDRVKMKAVSPVADFSWDYHDLDFEPVATAEK